MDISSTRESTESLVDYDREKELKAFDDSKTGVKGLVDNGVVKVPKIFIQPPDELVGELSTCQTEYQVPVIDLNDVERIDRRNEVVDEIRIASERWGFFQVVNHGIPLSVLDGMVNGIRMFHEQDPKMKKGLYTRDRLRKVRLESNFDLYQSRAANWRDTLNISMLFSDHLDPNEIPAVCRATSIEYIDHVSKLGNALFELLSEALGLNRGHLTAIKCGRGCNFVCHYYPACPEPELTLGASKHTDPTFLTILLQDQIGGLQVMHKNQWINVQPIVGGLVINVGDFLQIISNDRFKSVSHRVLANCVGPRISVASFFTGAFIPPKLYGPIKELISEENPPLYKQFFAWEYLENFSSRALDKSGLDHLKL